MRDGMKSWDKGKWLGYYHKNADKPHQGTTKLRKWL